MPDCELCGEYVNKRFTISPNADQLFNLVLNKQLDTMTDNKIQERIDFINSGLKVCNNCKKSPTLLTSDPKVVETFNTYELQDNYLRNSLQKYQQDKLLAQFPAVPTKSPTKTTKKSPPKKSPTTKTTKKSPKSPTKKSPTTKKTKTTKKSPSQITTSPSCASCENYLTSSKPTLDAMKTLPMSKLLQLKRELSEVVTRCTTCKDLCKDPILCKKYSNFIKLYNQYLILIELQLSK